MQETIRAAGSTVTAAYCKGRKDEPCWFASPSTQLAPLTKYLSDR